jgi:hypothetical protein
MRTKGSFYKKKECRVCESIELIKAVELTPTPPGNNFLSIDELTKEEAVFPLELDFCSSCHHIQLGHVVEPSFLFQNDYSYVSATSSVFVEHLSLYSDHITELLGLNKNSLVIDIGSNDGTCLGFFKQKGMPVLGVDPATKIANDATERGIPTLPNFFGREISLEINKNHGKASLITSHNACAHIDDLGSVIEGVEILLEPEGVFVMEVGYFLDVFQNKWFDTIYHEHVDFHTVAPLKKLFSRFNLQIFRVERISPQGGSIRVMVQRIGASRKIENSVEDIIDLEKEAGLDSVQALYDFQKNIDNLRDKFKKMLNTLKEEGKSVAAFGAPTKATTLCYHFGINKTDIDFIVDDNPMKQGLFSPGKHIPVFSSDKIYEDAPDYLLILAWNFSEPIMSKHVNYHKEIGTFFLPMPQPTLVHKL